MAAVQEAPGPPGQDVAAKLAPLAELEATMAVLRSDLRGILTPALFAVDLLLAHPDPMVVKAGEAVVKAVTRAEARLVATCLPVKQRFFG